MSFSIRFFLILFVFFSMASQAQILIDERDSQLESPKKSLFATENTLQNKSNLAQMTWSDFQVHIDKETSRQRQEGLAYMVSSSLVFLGATVGFHSVDQSLEKSIYSVSQTLAIAAFGYGFYQYNVGSHDRQFFQIIENTSSLTLTQKNEILNSYAMIQKEKENTNKWTRFFTYLTISGLNFVQASQESNSDIKNTMYFIGGASALAAISVHF
ncbi:MAG: hypothetical protein KDD34_00165 [Bdellovibrionales bacterium]|nr:hypothetical protein [Bdellovibrionales bacterium]